MLVIIITIIIRDFEFKAKAFLFNFVTFITLKTFIKIDFSYYNNIIFRYNNNIIKIWYIKYTLI